MTEMAKSTPLILEDAQITNYDWPPSITKAQEELAAIQLKEAAAAAQVRADLQTAKGQLAVEEAKKLVELKKAEAVAESIDIIKRKLAGAPEYLMWHQIRQGRKPVFFTAKARPLFSDIFRDMQDIGVDIRKLKIVMMNAGEAIYDQEGELIFEPHKDRAAATRAFNLAMQSGNYDIVISTSNYVI
jgi:hypothetical protein